MNALQKLIFPDYCINCKSMGLSLCEKCKSNLEMISFETCIMCDKLSIMGLTHSACKNLYAPDRCVSLYNYNKIARQIILKSKYWQKSYRLLSNLIHIQEIVSKIAEIDSVDIVMPTPMTVSFQKRMNINHSLYIANEVSKIKKIHTVDALIKDTKQSQKSLNKDYRKHHLKGKILIKKHLVSHIKNKTVLLVDDVLTTGATMIESSKILKMNGAKTIICLTLTKDQFDNV